MAYVALLGFNLAKATGYSKVVNFASNLSSLAFFLWQGNIYFAAGIVMGAGQILGAKLEYLEKMGVEFKCNVKVGEDITLDELFRQGDVWQVEQ